MRKILGFLADIIYGKGDFPYSVRGFKSAKRWASMKPNPRSKSGNLFDSINSNSDDGWWVLYHINKHKNKTCTK
jgi:hypothetical protein